MPEDLGERTEDPTARRLSEARDEGRTPRSQDLSSAIDLTGAVLLIALLGGGLLKGLESVMRRVFDGLDTSLTYQAVEPVLFYSFWQAGRVALPFLLIVFAVAAVSQYAQVGWRFTARPLAPNWSRLNPISGFGNLIGRRNLVKTLVNSVKLAFILSVAWAFLSGIGPKLAALPALAPASALYAIGGMAVRLALWLLTVMLVIGVIDWLYQRWQHKQDLKMTRSDVKDERRSMEGDPQVKSYRLKMMQKIMLQRINSAVPKADVIVTNPTHFSVAIQYESSKMRAPKVIAKGADFLAMRIREVATTGYGVPILERPPLARALYFGVEVGQEISAEHYQAVAEILAYVYRLEKEAA